eukprot:359585-Chlamydomonas_euryale.AAC.8
MLTRLYLRAYAQKLPAGRRSSGGFKMSDSASVGLRIDRTSARLARRVARARDGLPSQSRFAMGPSRRGFVVGVHPHSPHTPFRVLEESCMKFRAVTSV